MEGSAYNKNLDPSRIKYPTRSDAYEIKFDLEGPPLERKKMLKDYLKDSSKAVKELV